METFSARLRKLRLSKNLTLKEVAEHFNVPATTYRDWEYGKAIQGEPYLAIADFYQISLHELLTGEKKDKNDILQQITEVQKKLNEISRSVKALF